ncbi:MAG: hypothetical protein QM568_00425 [Microbacterium sp.]
MFLLGGCTATSDPPSRVAVYESVAGNAGAAAAQLFGILTVEAGCTYLQDADGTRWLPVFADSVSSATQESGLRYGATTFLYGEEAELPGGETTRLDSDTIPAACDEEAPIWRVAQP